jgi:methionine aminotransferase
MSALAKEYNAVNLSQGFPDFEPSQKLRDLVTEYLGKNTAQYAPMPGLPALREKIAQKILFTHGVSVDPASEITITVGATEGIFCAITGFVYPGDEVILLEPCFDCYRPLIEIAGGTPVVYKMRPPDFSIDWTALAKLVTPKTRMICISTPNNPTGTLFSHSDMMALINLVKDTNIFIMCDEVYEHMIFDGKTHISPLQYPVLRERTFSNFSFGKTYHATGWKVGYCVAPTELTVEVRKVHQNSVYSISHPLQAAIAAFMEYEEEYLGLSSFFQNKRDLFLQSLKGSRLKPLPCASTYFQLFDYSAISTEPDFDFCTRLVKDFGVASIPVSRLYSDLQDDCIIRFCFAKKDETLIKAGELLKLV